MKPCLICGRFVQRNREHNTLPNAVVHRARLFNRSLRMLPISISHSCVMRGKLAIVRFNLVAGSSQSTNLYWMDSIGLVASTTRSLGSVANAFVKSTWKRTALSFAVAIGSIFSCATGDMYNFFKSIIFFRDISCGVKPSTRFGEIELLLLKLSFGMTKRVSSLPHCCCGILILFETNALSVAGDILVDSSDRLLFAFSVVHWSGTVSHIESISVCLAGALLPNIFGKLNFFLWMPFRVARCFNKSVKELGLESYLT